MDEASRQRAAVKGLRDAIAKPMKVPMHQLQQASLRDPGITAPIWVSKVKLPAPHGSGLRELLYESLLHLGDDAERAALRESEYSPHLEAEWTGIRADGKVDKAPDLSERQKYDNLVRDQKSALTIFYLQGGSFVTGNATTGRRNITELCRVSGARAFSVSYRLSPQNPFPQNLLDIIVAYFYLISPPPGSQHAPIPPTSIVFAAESAGSSLTLGLIQFLLYLQQQPISERLATTQQLVKNLKLLNLMPAGCAFISPVPDMTSSLPSTDVANSTDWMVGGAHWHRDYFPADHLWPSKPPRADIIGEGALLTHPMLSPMTRRQSWAGAPPIWMAVGDEASSDGAKICAQRLAENRVRVKYVRYEGMPHIWPMLMPKLPQSKHVLREWGIACKEIYERKQAWVTDVGNTEVTTVHLGKPEQTTSTDFSSLTGLSFDNAMEILLKTRAWKMDPKNVWTGPKVGRRSSL